MRNKVEQLSLFDTYTDVLETMEENKSELVELLEEYIDFETIIPPQFQYAYYNQYGRKRINALVHQHCLLPSLHILSPLCPVSALFIFWKL